MKAFVKSINYRSPLIYNILDYLKRGTRRDLRYRPPLPYLKGASSVLDLCGGTGEFKKFLPAGCQYSVCDASPGFVAHLAKSHIRHFQWDLHRGLPRFFPKVDAVVMIISLYQFRTTSIDVLLEAVKDIASTVVIVEEVSVSPQKQSALTRWVKNYLCATDFFVPVELFVREEFESIMKKRRYDFISYDKKYCVGCYHRQA